jgi:hypothetical protein
VVDSELYKYEAVSVVDLRMLVQDFPPSEAKDV